MKCAYEICVIQPINGTMLVDAGTDADGADNLDGDGVLFYPGVAGPLSSIRLVRPPRPRMRTEITDKRSIVALRFVAEAHCSSAG